VAQFVREGWLSITEIFKQVQSELERRNEIGAQYSSSDMFASKLICEDCGGFYGKKKWHSNSKYSRFIYQCNKKFHKHKERCQTPNLKEGDIKLKFVQAYNIVMEDKERVIQDTNEVIELLTDTTQLDEDISSINDEIIVISELVNKLVKENSKTSIRLDDFNKKYDELTNRYERSKARQEELLRIRSDKKGQALKMKSFLTNLTQAEDELEEWNENIWMLMIDKAVVHRDSSITFKFHNDYESQIL
jgi:site-specific DNA recombinase